MLYCLGFLGGQESVQFFCRHTSSYLMVGNTDNETTHSVEEAVKFEMTNNKNEVSVLFEVHLTLLNRSQSPSTQPVLTRNILAVNLVLCLICPKYRKRR